jgi:hypothetical protein
MSGNPLTWFTRIGRWERNSSGEAFVNGKPPADVGLYAFVTGSQIQYVGIAGRGIQERMKDYTNNQNKQNRSRPVHRGIADALDRKEQIDVYAFVPPPDVEQVITWNESPVHFLVGLEAALILQLNPAWNRRGRTEKAMELPPPLSGEE